MTDAADNPAVWPDYVLIHAVCFQTASNASSDLKAKNGNQRIAFIKVFDDGTVSYLVDVSRKKKDLQSVSMWKYPKGTNADTALSRGIKKAQRAYSTTIDEKQNVTANQTSETEADIALDGNNTPQTANSIKTQRLNLSRKPPKHTAAKRLTDRPKAV